MLTREENDLLCRVEGDAPMGRLMRRHWVPAVLAEEVSTPGGNPVRVRLFGEDLVAFRDTTGAVGVIGEACPHRKASLALGRNEAGGLRCLYHGWLVDRNGDCLDMPSEPPDSGFCARVKHKAYPVREGAGFVWVYMGEPAGMPVFEPPPWAPTAEARVSTTRMQIPCNWAQVTEGQIDSAHSSSLHASDMRPARVETAEAVATHWLRPSTDKSPRLQVQLTSYGMRYAAIRRPIKNAATHDYVRITTFVAPFTSLIPPNSSYNVATVIVPRDDTSCWFHFIAWTPGAEGGIAQEAWRKFCVMEPGVDVDAEWRPARGLANRFLQDRARMGPDNVTGIAGIPNQDLAMWLTMGPIADRSSERLGASDIAVIQFRRLMIDAARRNAATGEALGISGARVPPAKLRSWQGIVPKAIEWRALGAEEEELAMLGIELDETEREMARAAG